ncbi:helicase-exonuclease AddAB subunit AddB [Clostridium sp. 19966]|uniref:helicase-exonuclease AddAB subunit AddB n=1 Tax=Clostridium sp. 19966 TaxID=2768166 RepID=UPI0028DEAC33|nr:helicase-exonuclease AddAB subunit AddB [Clostridium sp. 19966]MDT8718868.1 helicase-exonuclease AddAB subunit AddB [Clostridium sp. 19966]
MSLRFIYGRGGCGKSHFCLEDIKGHIDKKDKEKLVMLVPEQYSFQAERNLLRTVGAAGIIEAEVLSFKRMCHRVFNEVGGVTLKRIDEAGKNMLLYNIIDEIKDELKIFNKASRQQGFIDVVAETIKEFKRYKISPEMLGDTMSDLQDDELKYKLTDLKYIYEVFDNALHKDYMDGEDELNLLSEKIDSCHIFDGAEIWIDEFSTFTPQQYAVIEKLMKKCRRVNVALCCDRLEGTYDNTDVFSVVKNTEKKLLRLAADNNISYDNPVDLNKECAPRYKISSELQHLEAHFFSFPFKYYKAETEKLRLYKAQNSYEEIEQAAKDIVKMVRDNNYRYRDIAVVCRDLNSYERIIAAIFNQYRIPYFMDMKRQVTSNPLVIMISSIFEIFTRSWSYEAVFRYLKTGLTDIAREDIDLIENYVLANGIKGKRWTEEERWNYKLNYGEDNDEVGIYESEILERINNTKEKIVEPISRLQSNIKGDGTIRNMCIALYDFMLEIGALEKIESWSDEFRERGEVELSREYEQITDIVMGIFNQIVEVMGEEKVSLDKFMKMISVGFEKHEMGLIPVSLDEVMIGDIARIRSQDVKALYIIGVNDGVFPRASREEGILSDKDRNILKEKGVELAADTKTQSFEEQYLVYTTLTTASEFMMLSYPISDFEGKTLRPSIVVSKLKKLFPRLQEDSELLAISKDKLDHISVPEPTFNRLIAAVRKQQDGEEVQEEIWGAAYNWFDSQKEWKMKASRIFEGLKYSNVPEKVSSDKIRKLYGAPLYLSVSRLEQYAQCPFAYYLKYGLEAKDRKVYEFSSPDFGSFIHNILDKFTDTVKLEGMEWKDIDKAWCENTVELLVDNELNMKNNFILNSSARYKNVTHKLKRILTRSVNVMVEHIKRSSFEPLANELIFGKGGDLPPIKLKLPSGDDVLLRGRIDRVDSMDMDGEVYFRVVDYKSGAKKFSLSQVYYGLQLQLLVYLDALITNSNKYVEKQSLPGAVLYFKVDDPMIMGSPDMTDEDIEKEILKKLKMSGLLLKDAKVVKNMDNKMSGFSLIIPARMNAGDTLGSTPSTITMEQFDILRKYVRDTLASLCEDIISGNIDIKPTKEKNFTACAYCSFAAICQFDPSMNNNKYRYVNKKSDKELWQLMTREAEGEEEENHGE